MVWRKYYSRISVLKVVLRIYFIIRLDEVRIGLRSTRIEGWDIHEMSEKTMDFTLFLSLFSAKNKYLFYNSKWIRLLLKASHHIPFSYKVGTWRELNIKKKKANMLSHPNHIIYRKFFGYMYNLPLTKKKRLFENHFSIVASLSHFHTTIVSYRMDKKKWVIINQKTAIIICSSNILHFHIIWTINRIKNNHMWIISTTKK